MRFRSQALAITILAGGLAQLRQSTGLAGHTGFDGSFATHISMLRAIGTRAIAAAGGQPQVAPATVQTAGQYSR